MAIINNVSVHHLNDNPGFYDEYRESGWQFNELCRGLKTTDEICERIVTNIVNFLKENIFEYWAQKDDVCDLRHQFPEDIRIVIDGEEYYRNVEHIFNEEYYENLKMIRSSI